MPQTFTQRDKDRVIIIISKTVSSTIIPTVMRFETEPPLLWNALKQKYESAATQRKLDLKKSLLDLKMTEGTSVQDYLQSIERHVAELGRVGESVPDQELIQTVLRNLPESWHNFVAVYGVMFAKESPDATYANLEEYL